MIRKICLGTACCLLLSAPSTTKSFAESLEESFKEAQLTAESAAYHEYLNKINKILLNAIVKKAGSDVVGTPDIKTTLPKESSGHYETYQEIYAETQNRNICRALTAVSSSVVGNYPKDANIFVDCFPK